RECATEQLHIVSPMCNSLVARTLCGMRVTRDVVLPVSADEAWRLLTDPDELATWLGTPVDLDMAPGGAATLVEFDGTVRHAVIESVDAERHLGFVWWT